MSGGAQGADQQKARAVELLKWVRGVTAKCVEGFPPDKVTYQRSPADNHLLWVLGHIAATNFWILMCLGAKVEPLPEKYQALFGMGSKPVSDASVYPGVEELRRAFEASFEATLAHLDTMSDSDLLEPCAIDTGGFAVDKMDALYKAVWHEGWHAGQVATLRKDLGLPSVMG